MNANNTYEKRQFTNPVNIICPESFPHAFPLHWHSHVELVTLLDDAQVSRRPVLRVNQEVYTLDPGDILLIWSGEVHETVENADGQMAGLQFPTSVLNDLPDFAPFLHLFRTFHHIDRKNMPELAGRMASHIRQMLAIQRESGTFSGVEMTICLYELFMDFGNYLENRIRKEMKPRSAGRKKAIGRISEVCSYIVENCDRELTLESAAAHAEFSACYFSRVFKQVTGYHFVDYLTLQRIKRVQMLLAESDLTITEIAYQAGFKSISTFNRAFRQHRGCSPSEYRSYYLKERGY